MVVVDTTVWVDYLRGTDNLETLWLDRELGRQRLGLTDLILCEVLQGIQDDTLFAQTRSELLNFQVFESNGIELAIASALNYRKLRQGGYTVRKTIDCLIATFCIETKHQLLHRDRDFDLFERKLGLQVVHP
jgi:predicted nucleic acid-binding protein